MYKTHFLFLLIALSVLAGMASCNDDFEDYTTNPSDLPAFSSDTVWFDTVLTTINSPVKMLKVKNNHKKPILISSVFLEKGSSSDFKINVDGMAGATFQNVEVGSKDSIYILIDVKPTETREDTPVQLLDYLTFVTNGVTQKVVLEAYCQDFFLWDNVSIAADTVLTGIKPFLIRDTLVVEEGVTLTVSEGLTFYMDNTANILVKGTLKLLGTQSDPVTIRGSRTDYYQNIPYDRVPSQWGGITFAENSFGNEMIHARVRNGKNALSFERSVTDQSKMEMKNTVVTNFSGYLIQAVNCRITAENCELSNARFHLLYLLGGEYAFTHCTIANYMPTNLTAGWQQSYNETIYLSDRYTPVNPDGGEVSPEYFPNNALFANCIVAGRGGRNSWIIARTAPEGESAPAITYSLQSCIVPNVEETTANKDAFVNCLFANNDMTFPAFHFQRKDKTPEEESNEVYLFDFRLQKDSPAVGKANDSYSVNLPTDINGVDRLSDGAADIGAYEYVALGNDD